MQLILLAVMFAITMFASLVVKQVKQKGRKDFRYLARLSISRDIRDQAFKEQIQAIAQQMGVEDNNSGVSITDLIQMQKQMEAEGSIRFHSRFVTTKAVQHDSHLVKRVTMACRLLELPIVHLQIIKRKGDRNNGEVIFGS